MEGVPGASGSGDSLDGLKFGKKIYFEDVGSAQTSSSSSSGAKKSKGAGQGGGGQQQHPRCQVEGCGEDLSGEKPYYCRHKVCIVHSKSPKVMVAGLEQRFCQQCSRFHQLPEFDQGKRSCRRRLAGHNERRRKPPPISFSSRYGQFMSFHDDGSRYGNLLMDFAHPGLQGTMLHAWPITGSSDQVTVAQWPIRTDAGSESSLHPHPFVHSSAAGILHSIPDIPPDCALSLLSTQPWGSSYLNTRSPGIQQNQFEDNSVSQPVIPTSFLSSRWGFRDEEGCGVAHQAPQQIGIGQAAEPVACACGQSPGELELALQGRPCLDQGREPCRNGIHWSL